MKKFYDKFVKKISNAKLFQFSELHWEKKRLEEN